MTGNGADVADVVRDTIYRATLLLDDQKWEQWLYLAILPAGFVVAALCGALVGRL